MKVCIVSHNAYGAMAGGGHVGGVEMQTAELARYLAAQGHETSILVWDETNGATQVVADVNLVPICRRNAGIPILKFFWPRWTSLSRCLREVDADVYYHNGAEYFTGLIAIYCRANNKPFVFSTASDDDCSVQLEFLGKAYERWLYRWGLRNADAVICQTGAQERALLENFDRPATTLPMPCSFDVQAVAKPRANRSVLWVGRIIELKRLEMYLDIAERLPSVDFYIAGGADDDADYANQMISRAESIANVSYLGVLDRKAMVELYAQNSLLICTSRLEGFPNTFIEAWGSGVPVITTYDPDNVIRDNELGTVANSVTDLAADIESVLDDDSRYQALRKNALQYFKQHHERRVALGRFAEFLQLQLK